jgi:hypothetical protein
MGTKNPKISAYVPQEVFDRFQEFQEKRGLTASKAATAIFCDYFGIEQTTSSLPSGITLAQFQALEKRLADLEDKFESQPIYQSASLMPSELKRLELNYETPQLPFPESDLLQSTSELLKKSSIDVVNVPSVLSGNELAVRFSISSSKLSTEKTNRTHEQFTEWSKELDPDGVAWKYRGKQKGKGVEYFPVE